MLRNLCSVAVLLSLFAVVGCGGGAEGGAKVKTAAFTGKLTLDGKPYGKVKVQFIPEGSDAGVRTAYAEVKDDGSFAATTYVTGDGIVPGKYTVRVGSEGDGGSTDPAAMMAAVTGEAIEPFTVDVPADGLTDVELKLTSSKKKAGAGGMLGQ
ncbi:MAG TPA: hypothetical protein DCR20_13505 [Planctomycetaceae bacterium]|nr:hypothetical protein [Planctomycetaceae bacterium]